MALEDFGSILDVPAAAKYDHTVERMARGLRPLSIDPAADLHTLFRRAVFAWLIADGDMHLMNLALRKMADPGAKVVTTVRFASLADAIAARVFPGLGGDDRMALKLNGKDARLTRQDFFALAGSIGPRSATPRPHWANVPGLCPGTPGRCASRRLPGCPMRRNSFGIRRLQSPSDDPLP